MTPMVCEHGQRWDDGRFAGTWSAPFSRCRCCGVDFPYIDMACGDSRGVHGRSWTPKDLCPQCGGKYKEF